MFLLIFEFFFFFIIGVVKAEVEVLNLKKAGHFYEIVVATTNED